MSSRFQSIVMLTATLVVVVCALMARNGCIVEAGNDMSGARNFKDLLTMTEKLESAVTPSDDQKDARRLLLFQFGRTVKSVQCLSQYEQTVKISEEFKKQAMTFADESVKKQWFSGMRAGGAMRAMKGMGRYDKFLSDVAENYDKQMKSGFFNIKEIDCDLSRFKLQNLHKILFVLNTDIKYLITNKEIQLLNRAIYEQLKLDAYRSHTNFHAIYELTKEQNDLLLNFYLQRIDTRAIKIGEAIDHFHAPGEFIFGRLIDSCQSVTRFENDYQTAEKSRKEICPELGAASVERNALFGREFSFEKYQDIFELCHNLLESL